MQAHVHNKVEFAFDGLADAFPEIDPGFKPLGSRILVQVRRSKSKTKHGIILPDEVRDTEQWNTQVAKVIAIGPLAFKNRNTMQPWPEGDWVKEGSFVRAPKYGGDRFGVPHDGDEIIFVVINDLDLVGVVTGDPLAMKAFI